MKQSKEFFIFSINGGAGKNIMATAVARAIKNNFPDTDIIVLTAHPDIWLFNTTIYRHYQFGQCPYFYEDYIKGKNTKILAIDPYFTEDYILKKKHLIEIWCELAGTKYGGEKPQLFFNQREVDYVKRKALDGRKVLLLQTNGGYQKDIKISWMRDMPLDTAQKVVNHFSKEYRIVHIRRPDQPQLSNTETFNGSIRELFSLIRFSDKRLFIDSACQHIASALNKESTVLWIGNRPEMLGYPIHDNIVTRAEEELNTLKYSVLEPYDITGNIYQCPFAEGAKLFDEEEIIESIKRQNDRPYAHRQNGRNGMMKAVPKQARNDEGEQKLEEIEKNS